MSRLARDRKNLMGTNRFAMWAVALQKRDARTSPCSELAPNGKVARVALMAFSAATSGQIVVPAFRLFVYALKGYAESYRKAFRDTNYSISVQGRDGVPAHDNDFFFAPRCELSFWPHTMP